MLTARDVSYGYEGDRPLASHINLVVAPGEAVSIEAPSGVGKSTLLAVFGGLLSPIAGTLEGSATNRRNVAWIPQSLPSLSARTVVDNVATLAILDGMSRERAEAAALSSLEDVDLVEFASRRSRTLSGGELQRMTVARAIACQRPVVFADEPTSHLDQPNARRVFSSLVRLASTRERAVVIVTHDHDSLPPIVKRYRLTSDGLREQ